MQQLIALCLLMAAPAQADTQTVQPQDTGEALVNPMMGWTLHFYSNLIENYGSKLAPSDTMEDFPGLSVVYLRLPWSYIEPREGQFDWSIVDTPTQRFIDQGKQVAFRISTSESWLRWATPEWVKDAGAKGYNFKPGEGVIEDGPFWEPDFADPVFLEKHDNFLKELARRYDGNPNVAFIDVANFGVWGEGHTLASTKREYPLDVLKTLIDQYVEHFDDTLLVISDDWAGHDKPGDSFPITDYALEKGISLRDDSILVQPPPRSWYHDELAQSFWPKHPVVLEHEHYGPSVARGAWDEELFMKAVEDYHASYMSIHWWPHEFLEKNRALIDRVNLRLGYRIMLEEATWPRAVALGQPFMVALRLANKGVAPCYPGGYAALTLKDAEGGIVSVNVLDQLDVRDLPVAPPGEAEGRAVKAKIQVAKDNFGHVPPVAPGSYDVFVSVGKLDGTPEIALPLENEDGHRRYRIGSIELLPRQQ